MTTTFRPMLAQAVPANYNLPFPVWASTKLDGIRTIILDGKAVSRNLKPIRNRYVRQQLEDYAEVLNGYDGELLLTDLTKPFNEVSSALTAFDGEPDFTFAVFDNFLEPSKPYMTRFMMKAAEEECRWPHFAQIVGSTRIADQEQLDEYEEQCIAEGFEGVMVRRADGLDRYKFGRSTVNELCLGKVKRFVDFEAVVTGFVERMHNDNDATTDALGLTARSSHQANMVPMGTLGSLLVYSDEHGEFNVGSGFDDALRQQIWDNRSHYLGATVTVKSQPSGAKDKPRFPTFKGFRYDIG